MKCVNISHPDFKKLLKETGRDSFELETDITLWQERTGSDGFPSVNELPPSIESITEVFKDNPELANVGTPQQYSAYLATIFPDSKVQGIVYRAGALNSEEYAEYMTDHMDLGEGFYLSGQKEIAREYGEPNSILINVNNPKNLDVAYDERVEYGQTTSGDVIPKLDENGKYDSIIDLSRPLDEITELVVFDSNQMYKLGSQKDIENFKNFVQTKKNTFYDTGDNVKSLPEAQVDAKITELLNQSGISVSQQKVYADGYEARNGKPLSVAAKADLTNSLIEYNPEMAGKLTIAEEAMHFILAANQGDYNFNRAMRLIERHKDYDKLMKQYLPLYDNNTTKAKMEVLGKVGSEILYENIKSPLLRYLKRMYDRVLQMLGSKKAELRLILDKYATTFIDSGVQTDGLVGEFYDVGDTGYITKARIIYEDIVKGLWSKIDMEKQKGYKPYKLEEAYYDIREADHTKGMLMFLEYMADDTISMVRFISDVKNKKAVIDHNKLQLMHQSIMFYRKNVQRLDYFLTRDFKKNPNFTNKQRNKLVNQLNNVVTRLNNIEANHRVYTQNLAKSFAIQQAKDSISDPEVLKNEIESIDKAIKNVDYDMNQLMYWVGSLAHTKEGIVKGLHSAVVKANQKVNRFGYRLGQELIAKAKELGITDMTKLMEKDQEGFNGYFKTRLKRGAWQKAFQAKRTELHNEFDLPDGNDPEAKEKRAEIKHDWSMAAKEYKKAFDTLGDRDQALASLDSETRGLYLTGVEYRTKWAKWFNRNTRPIKNLNEVINEKKKTLNKQDYEYWYNKNIGRAMNGDLYYKNELIEPSDGSNSAKKEGGKYIKTTNWSNPDFNSLSKNEVEMIEFFESKMREADEKHTKTRQSYRLPQVRASFVNLIKNKKFNNLGEQIKEEFKIVEDDTEFGEKLTYPDGTVAKFVPMHFVTPLENTDNISTDLLYSTMLYGRQAEDFKTKASLEPAFNTVLRQLGERTVNNETGLKSESYKAVEKFIDMNIYGQHKDDFKVMGINVSKALTKMKNYVTANNLVFNLFTTVAGYMTSNVYSKIEDLTGQYSNQKAKIKADKTFIKNIHKALLDIGRPDKTNKFAIFLEEHGIIKDSDQTLKNLDLSRLSRTAINSGLYAQYELVKIRVRGKLALALAHDLKYLENEQKFFTTNELKAKGVKDIDSLPDYWDMHEVKDHKLVAKHKDKSVFEKYANKVDYIGNNLEGELNQTDYAAAHQHAVLQLVTTHRGWLFRNVQLRLKPKGINYITGQEEVGYYTGFFEFVKAVFFSPERIRNLKDLINRWQELDNTQRYAVRRTMYELAFVNAVASIAFILNGIADNDEDSWLKQYLAYQSTRVLLEVSALNPFPAIAVGPDGVRFRPPVLGATTEILEILNSPIAATRQIEDLQDLLHIFSSEEIDRGPYEGMTKGERALLKLGIGTKGIYQSRTAEAIEYQNRFLKNKVLDWMKD